MTDKNTSEIASQDAADGAPVVQSPNVVWNDSKMNTAYANVVNVSCTREEVTVFFGTNQTWNTSESKEIEVLLSDRMILNPHAAKRLWALMSGVLNQYEKRYGAISLDLGKKPE